MKQTDLLIALQSDVDCFSGATLDTPLESLPRWDSLSILLVISHIEANYKIILSGQQIRECRTVRDLLNLIPTL
jgi:acyl carrier protein